MKPSLTFVFLGLFIVVGVAFYYLIPSEKKVENKSSDMESMTLLKLEDDDQISLLQIQNLEDNESITIQREEEAWIIKHPIAATADSFLVNGLVTALTVTKKARRLQPDGDLGQYGLSKPSLKIGIETEQEGERRYLLLGEKAPLGKFIFAKWDNEEGYFLLDENVKNAFNKSVYSLRLKQIFPLALKDMVKIRFRLRNEEFEMARHDEKWFWMEPIPILGEVIAQQHIDEVLSRIRDLYVKDFLDKEKREPSKLGFEVIGPSIKVWSADQEEPDVLQIGDDVVGRDAVYGKMKAENSYFLIAKSNVGGLFSSVQDLAKKFANQEISSGNILA